MIKNSEEAKKNQDDKNEESQEEEYEEEPNSTLFVKNLNFDTDEATLQKVNLFKSIQFLILILT